MSQAIEISWRSAMRRLAASALSAVLLLAAGCVTAPPQPVRSEFEDIPVPKGLTGEYGQAMIIESPTVKAARLFYKGRIEPESLAVAFRTTLEANGWHHVSSTTFSKEGTTQVYEKEGDSLKVYIYKDWWYTKAEITATRVLSRPPKQ